MARIILNRIKTPDGTILISRTVHDFQVHLDKNGETYFIDGGTSYLRRSVNKIPYEELSLYDNEPYEIIRENYYRGAVRNNQICWIPISQMSNQHLRNAIKFNNVRRAGLSFANQMYRKELRYRSRKNIEIKDTKYED